MNRNQNTIQSWDKLAQKYQEKFMNVTLYDASYDSFCEAVANENASILEIGSGPGNITKYLLNKHPKYQILGTDVAPSMIELAQINNPYARFQVLDARNINRIDEKFNAVMCGFCLPYLSKEESIQLIKDSHKLLNDGGILYFSVIEKDYENSESQTSSEVHYIKPVQDHQADYLAQTAVECDFGTANLLCIKYPKRIRF